MIQILVKLTIRDAAAFDSFESSSIGIMREYQGELLTAFEADVPADRPATEIHVLQFPDIECFDQYRADPRLAAMADLRARAIGQTEILVSRRLKRY